MAKPTANAVPICIGATVAAAVGVAVGLLTGAALVAVVLLLPAAAYEAYRTEGASTRWASWTLVAVLVAEIVVIALGVSIDLAALFGATERAVGGYTVPLGDIRVVGAAAMVVLGAILISRTRGVYTRWLAAVIIVGAAATAYILSPEGFPDLLRSGVDQAAR